MAFSGFPSGTRYTSVPNPLFGPLLEEIQDLAELKVVLRGIWLLQRKRGWPRLVSQEEFLTDNTLVRAFQGSGNDAGVAILHGLELAVKRGIFLAHRPQEQTQNAGPDDTGSEASGPANSRKIYYLLNAERDRAAISKLPGWAQVASELDPPGSPGISGNADLPNVDRPNIFTLYEDNVGMISPFVAEELKEAEELYPWSWLSEAFKISATQNRRSWNYIVVILRRWASEGKTEGKASRTGEQRGEGRDDGKPGRHSATGDRQKHIEDYQRRRRQIRDQPTKR